MNKMKNVHFACSGSNGDKKLSSNQALNEIVKLLGNKK